jgi:hypothetical protein
MGIALRGRQRRVAQELLNGAKIRSSVEHVSGAGVTQSVGMQIRATRARRAVALDNVPDRAWK